MRDPHRQVVLGAGVEPGLVRLDHADQAVVVRIPDGLEPPEDPQRRLERLAQERDVLRRVVDALDRARDDRRLGRPGIERMREADRVLVLEPVQIAALLPEEHVRHEAVRLHALEQAGDLALRERRIDVEKRDGNEGGVPEPLERVGRRRRVRALVQLAVPRGDPRVVIPDEDPLGLGDDLVDLRLCDSHRTTSGARRDLRTISAIPRSRLSLSRSRRAGVLWAADSGLDLVSKKDLHRCDRQLTAH